MSKQPHLTIIANSIAHGGGAANAARAQVLALSEHFSITVITAQVSVNGSALNSADISSVNVVLVKPLQFNFLRRFGHAIREVVFCYYARSALLKLHAERKVDFVICHSHTSASIAALALRKKFGIKFAAVTHGDIFSRPKGSYDRILTALYKWATRKSYINADLIIALSPFMQEAAVKHGAHEQSIVVIPNGISECQNVSGSQQASTEVSDSNKLRLLSVGRLAIEKDITTLISAFSVALKTAQANNQNLSLTIVGDGPLMANYQHQVEKLSLTEFVQFLGQMDSQQVQAQYRQHDVFAISSISDPLPTVVLEAMRVGLPVIGSNVDGIPFMVKHGETGLLVRQQQVNEFAEAIIQLLNEPILRADMGVKGQQRVKTQFAWQYVAKQIRNEIVQRID